MLKLINPHHLYLTLKNTLILGKDCVWIAPNNGSFAWKNWTKSVTIDFQVFVLWNFIHKLLKHQWALSRYFMLLSLLKKQDTAIKKGIMVVLSGAAKKGNEMCLSVNLWSLAMFIVEQSHQFWACQLQGEQGAKVISLIISFFKLSNSL